ncbi:MAG: universal stress protein [Candidatus Brocadia sp.]|nr:universal stress protein [Candidatus Brocadia sp.]
MVSIKRIFFPTDFPECAEHALKYTVSLTSTHEAKLYVLHVITELNIPVGLGGYRLTHYRKYMITWKRKHKRECNA